MHDPTDGSIKKSLEYQIKQADYSVMKFIDLVNMLILEYQDKINAQ